MAEEAEINQRIQQAFSFLLERGFRVVSATASGVRYESNAVFVGVSFDPGAKRVGFSFGPLLWPGRAASLFDQEDLAELADPPGQLKWPLVRVRRPGQLEQVLAGYASFCQERGDDLLRGSPGVFDMLARRRDERTASTARRVTRRLAKHTPHGAQVVRRKLTPADALPGPAVVGKLVGDSCPETSLAEEVFRPEEDRGPRLGETARLVRDLLEMALDPGRQDEWEMRRLTLEPHPMDYERVFEPEVAGRARAAYRLVWERDNPVIKPDPHHDSVQISTFFSDWLRDGSRKHRYPPSYRRIAHMLQPDIVWAAGRFGGPGGFYGRTYDGLVCLDTTIAWFPRPGEVMGALLTE